MVMSINPSLCHLDRNRVRFKGLSLVLSGNEDDAVSISGWSCLQSGLVVTMSRKAFRYACEVHVISVGPLS